MAPPASRHAPPIERFLSRVPAASASDAAKRASGRPEDERGAFAAVLRSPELVREAQALFDQIVSRGEALEPLGAAQNAPPVRVWALVAVVATGITRELKQEKTAALGSAAASAPPSSTSSWHLVELLDEAGVSLLVFLQYFTSLFNRLLLDPELLEVTMLLKEEFTVASVLFEKYRVLWNKVTMCDDDQPEQEQEHESSDENSSSNGQIAAASGSRRHRRKQVFDAGWLLFLLAKRRLGAHYTGLGPLYYLLLAVLLLVAPQAGGGSGKVLLDASPSVEAEVAAALSALGSHDVKEEGGSASGPRTRRATKRSISSISSSTSSAPTTVTTVAVRTSAQILEALCAAPRVDPVEVTTALSHLTLVLKQLHERGELLVVSGLDKQGSSVSDSLFGGEDDDAERRSRALGDAFFHANVLEKNVARLAAVYKQEYLDGCGKLDERLYLNARTLQVITDGSGKSDAQFNVEDNGTSSTTSNAVDASAMRSPVRRNVTPTRRQAAANLANSNSSATHSRTTTPSSTPTTRGMMTPPPPRHQHPPAGFASPLRHSSGSWQWQAASSPAVVTTGSSNVRAFLPFASTSNQHYYRPSPAAVGSQTPVTAAVETSHWIRDTLAPAILRPVTPQLEAFFVDCATNPSQRIAQILDDRAALLLSTRTRPSPSSAPSMLTSISASLEARGLATDGASRATSGSSALQTGSFTLNAPTTSTATYSGVDGSLKRTRDLSVALFYRVLESLVRSERARLQTVDLSSLLNNEVFISALFTCCLEALLKTHALVTLSFPSLLYTTRVRAFDFGATIESFVKHSRLPPALKQHMRDIENRILDCLVWRSDSGLYASAGSDSTSANAGPRPGGLRLFFRMALSRAASRIYRLGTLLGLDTKSLNQVWTAVKECVCAHQHDLMRDRHLDQMVLCSIYGVSKANRSDMTFKRVNEAYKTLQRQQHSPPPSFLARTLDEVIRDIKLDDRGSRGDIIKFYNRCYVPVMKVFLLQFQMQDKQLAAADAAGAAVAGSSSLSTAPPGFTPRVQGAMPVATTVSDADIVADAALEAVDSFLAARSARSTTGGAISANGTPPRSRAQAAARSASSSPSALFSSATEMQTLPVAVAMRNASPHRVPASNVYMSPLQQVRLNCRSQTLTPRSHALYAFGESPARVRSVYLLFNVTVVMAWVTDPCAFVIIRTWH